MGVEIERKFTVKKLPEDMKKYPCRIIEQAYLNVSPAIRVRKEDDRFYMTYKSRFGFGEVQHGASEMASDGAEGAAVAGNGHGDQGGIGQTEYNLPLDEATYEHLKLKADGNIISKKRYIIPLNEDAFDENLFSKNPELAEAVKAGEIKIELDVFEGVFDGRILAEVEFPDEETAKNYRPADWFDEDVTGDPAYSNAHMSSERV